MRKQSNRSVLITDAARSQSAQLRSRQTKYVAMMGVRAACLILGAVLISAKPPLLPVWLGLCAAGMVFLPWAAVLIANDRPPKRKPTLPAPPPKAHPQVLTAGSGDNAAHRTSTAHQTIDVEP